MTYQISNVAFEAEISGLPDTIHALQGTDGGVAFADFSYDFAGDSVHRVSGLHIGTTHIAPATNLSFGSDNQLPPIKGDVFVRRGPGHEGSAAWDGSYRARFIAFAPNVVERMLRTPFSQIEISPIVDSLSDHRGVHHLLAALSESGPAASPEDPLLLESVALAVLRAAGVRSCERARKTPALSQAQIAVLYDLIASRLTQPLSLDDMASAVSLSESYFVRAFTGSFGISPYRYVLRERVALAQSLIRSGGLSLSQIASMSGFSDANRMSRTFRQMTGSSPSGSAKPKRPRPN